MKIALILVIAIIAAVTAAPVEEESAKAKRGIYGFGYHAPIVTHSHYVAAPAVVHHAPVYSHAPLISHAPLYSHAPIITHSSYQLPSYHTLHHFK